MKLWELTSQYRTVLERAAETPNPGEPEIEQIDREGLAQAFENTLEGLQGEITEKVDGCVAVMKTLEHTAESIRQEEIRMATRRRHLENKAERIRQYVIDCMEKTNTKTVESPLFRVTCATGPGSVNVTDESKLPESCFVVKREVSLSACKRYLKQGMEVPGAELVHKTQLRVT